MSLLLPLLPLLSLLPSPAVAQGAAACANLTASLGSDKVLYTPDPTYLYESEHYYDARSASNVPACVVLPADANDVSAALLAARAANSSFAVKSGGHTGNGDKGWSSTAGGVLIDLKDIDNVTYDVASGSVFFGAGNRFLNVYQQLADDGVTVVGGRLSDVGVGGWNVGGGLSYLSALWGLGVDNYVSLEVVLPDGSIVNASAGNDYSDLFYALKGGGNQFGVITTFESSAHAIGEFYAGDRTYSGDQIPALLNATDQFLNNYTDPNAAIIVTLTSTVDLPVPIVFLIYNLDGQESVPDGVFDMFTSIPALADTRSNKTYLETCTMNDFGSIYGPRQAFWSVPISAELSRLTQAYALYEEFATTYAAETTLVTMDLQPIPHSLVEYGTSRGGNPIFNGTEGPFLWLNILVDWEIAAYDTMLMAAAYNLTQAIGAEPGLPTFLNDADWMQNAVTTYPHYETLVQTKHKYDPDGFFTTYTGGPSYS